MSNRRSWLIKFILFLGVLSCFFQELAWAAAVTKRISIDSAKNQSDHENVSPALSANGSFVVFESYASNLVAEDTNGAADIFVRDRQTEKTTRVSIDSAGKQGNNSSYAPSISADGRWVAFQSDATNLVPGDNNGWADIFVHDRQTGKTTRVSMDSAGNQGNGYSIAPVISAEGRFVVFGSYASNLVAGDTNGVPDIFVHDQWIGNTTRVNMGFLGDEANDYSYAPAALSADGRFVAFTSYASNLVLWDTNHVADIFVYDRWSGETTCVSIDSFGNRGDYSSYAPALSADGRLVAFKSLAANLVDEDTNEVADIFVHDRQTGETTRASIDSEGNQSNGESETPALSANGRFVAFASYASNLVLGDNNDWRDIFLYNLSTQKTIRVSLDSAGNESNGISTEPALSADGRYVVFDSNATNLVANDSNGRYDIFMRERQLNPPASADLAITQKVNRLLLRD
jgi:Tol biopolymer transport system component